MKKINVVSAHAFDGECRKYHGSDGQPMVVAVPRVAAVDADRRVYVHACQRISVSTDEDGGDVVRFGYNKAAAEIMADRIYYRKYIDADYWDLIEDMSWEDRAQDNLEFEHEQRYLYGT